jgi:hypothetical protein
VIHPDQSSGWVQQVVRVHARFHVGGQFGLAFNSFGGRSILMEVRRFRHIHILVTLCPGTWWGMLSTGSAVSFSIGEDCLLKID